MNGWLCINMLDHRFIFERVLCKLIFYFIHWQSDAAAICSISLPLGWKSLEAIHQSKVARLLLFLLNQLSQHSKSWCLHAAQRPSILSSCWQTFQLWREWLISDTAAITSEQWLPWKDSRERDSLHSSQTGVGLSPVTPAHWVPIHKEAQVHEIELDLQSRAAAACLTFLLFAFRKVPQKLRREERNL